MKANKPVMWRDWEAKTVEDRNLCLKSKKKNLQIGKDFFLLRFTAIKDYQVQEANTIVGSVVQLV